MESSIAPNSARFLNKPTFIEGNKVDLAANAWYNTKNMIERNTQFLALSTCPVRFNSTIKRQIATIVINNV